ncbi:MAG: RNA binding S1 domain protein [Parcubacteria group bacterium GW2011_GWC1_45_9]|nr:MAG: RNA binding S1 domain protein [Parcubacteria group bacterium GW2011_GWA1_Parcubacteria_45_10]KKT87953.1 MAG: RNA binding S1 domain protein [Parcubacteria group bacterium GW2011_GWB1_45_10]KKU17438.1 MAG: RNA binding S1 domain protein [Parcubacteria group bacterium GW2011_GWC1_45_9]HCI05337.1 30S ribosomal protein S1 [Patescibacteria group bacterium]
MQQILETIKKASPGVGSILAGSVLKKEPRRLFIDLFSSGSGIILGKEYLFSIDRIRGLRLGDEVVVKVIGSMDENGFWEVSLNQADKEAGWEKVRAARDNREIVGLTVSGANQGGLLMQFEGIEGFLPVSQLALEHYPRVEGGNKSRILEELRKFVGKEMKVRVLDFNQGEGKLIFSEKEAEQEKLQNLLLNYKINDVVEGEITGIAPFGAFIRFGDPALEGLIHISEIDHKLVDDPSSYLKVGSKEKAKIINITNDRIFLSLKSLKIDPWDEIESIYKKGGVYSGRVIKQTQLGALISLDDYIYGVSADENLETEKTYSFKISEIDKKERKITLKLEK